MNIETPKGQAARFGVIGFALLGVWLVLVKIAEDLKLITSHTEATLSLASGVAVIALVTYRCRRSTASRAIKGVFLFVMLSICGELFLSFSGSVTAWNDVPAIGRASSTRGALKHLVLGGWTGGSMLLIYLLMKSAADSHQKLLQSEQRFRSFFEQAGVAVGVAESATGWIVEANQKFTDLTGYPRDELVQKTWTGLTYADDIQADSDRFIQLLSGEIPDFTTQQRLVRKDGTVIWGQITVSAIRNSDESSQHLVIIEEITDRKKLEEESRRREKLLAHANRVAIAGEMATGFAHELNQPLAAISLFAESSILRLRNNPDDTDRIIENLQSLAEQSQRAGAIVDRIRKFIGKEEFNRTAFRVGALFEETLSLLNQELSDHEITVDVQLPDSVDEVYADRVQIEQVLVNLVHNALDAMGESPSAPRRLELGARDWPDGYVEMSVRDFGPGMQQQEADKVFDAFYSTKSNGMGMGLAICRTIVETHGGHIQMVPHPHKGVTCLFTLPAHES